MYAYDAYFLDCALRQKAPLLTLDSRLKEMAKNFKISIGDVKCAFIPIQKPGKNSLLFSSKLRIRAKS